MTTPPPDATDIAELAARLERLSGDVELLQAAVAAAAEPGAGGAPAGAVVGGDPPSALYGSADDWAAGFFAPVYTRPIGGDLRWCPRWWEHAEAAIRLELLWRSWEAYRLRPLGAVEWHRDVLDHQLPILLSDRGPFAACTPERHEPSQPLPVTPTPIGWWDDADAPPAGQRGRDGVAVGSTGTGPSGQQA